MGILAYSVYKRQKTDFIARMSEKYGEAEVPVHEHDAFRELNMSEVQLAHYRRQAEALLENFAELALAGQSEQNRAELQSEYEGKLERLKPSFSFGMWQSVAGSIMFTVLIGVLVFILWSLKLGVQNAVESVFNVKITANPVPPRSTPVPIDGAK